MSAMRSRKEEMTYKRHRKSEPRDGCAFCAIHPGSKQFVEDYLHFTVIKNIFPYSLWDGQAVADHLMVIPKAHTDSLAKMATRQKAEYVDILEKYEQRGYNIYARAPASKIKSVVHQHTHLIKPQGKTKWFLLLIRKPYFRKMF